MKKPLLFLLLLLSSFSFSQTVRKVTMLNGLPATGTITYNDSSDRNTLSPWTIKIDIQTLDGSVSINTEYSFGTEEVTTDTILSSFFYQYSNDGNVIKKLTIKTLLEQDLDIDNNKWSSATFIDYSKKKVSYDIKFS